MTLAAAWSCDPAPPVRQGGHCAAAAAQSKPGHEDQGRRPLGRPPPISQVAEGWRALESISVARRAETQAARILEREDSGGVRRHDLSDGVPDQVIGADSPAGHEPEQGALQCKQASLRECRLVKRPHLGAAREGARLRVPIDLPLRLAEHNVVE